VVRGADVGIATRGNRIVILLLSSDADESGTPYSHGASVSERSAENIEGNGELDSHLAS